MRKIVGVIFSSFLFAAATAQDQKVIPITYNEALQIALKENVNLRQQYNLLESNEASRLGAKFRFLPSVSLNGTYQRIDGQQFDQVQGVLAFTESDRISGNLNANLTLFDGFNNMSFLKQSNYNFKAQENSVERSKQQLIFDVSQQYLQILLNKELLKIATDNLELQQTTLDQIEGFVTAGSRAKPDLFTQEAQVGQLEVLNIRAGNNYRRSKATLMQTLLLDPGVDLDPQIPEWDIEEISSLNYSLDEMYSIALTNRPDLKQNEYVVKSNQKAVSNASAGYYPTLTAFFSYGSNFSSLVAESNFTETNNFSTIGYLNGDVNQPVTDIQPDFIRATNEVGFNQQFLEDNLVTVYGLQLSIPLFDRFQTRTNRVVSKIQYENAKLDVDNLTRTIYLDIQNAFLDFQAAKKDYTASKKQHDAAQKALEVQEERFNVGIGNLVELSQANNVFILGASSLARATYTLLFQKVILDFNLGILEYNDIP